MTAVAAQQEWFTARELAALCLRDLPTSESAMIRYATRQGWNDDPARCRNRFGRGGGLEYHQSLIPTLAWMDLQQRTMIVGQAQPIHPPKVLPTPETERARRTQDARLAILAALERYGAGLNVREEGRLYAFTSAYNMGRLTIDDWVRELVPTVSKRSLFRWRSEAKAGNTIGFDRSTARQGKGVIDTANGGRVRTFLLALIAVNPHLSAAQVRTQIRAEFGDELQRPDGALVPVPPVRTIQWAMQRLRDAEDVALTKLSNPDKYRSTMAPAGTGTYSWVKTPCDLWMIDASPVDAICTDGRHSVYGCIDIATRRTVWYVSRTPRAQAVGLLLRKAIRRWGVPAKIKTDNGSDFASKETKRLVDALGIEIEYSAPYTPQQKGHIERAIGTFQRDCATLLPGFIGHNVADRKAIEDRKSFAQRLGETTAETFAVSMIGPELQAYIDQWAELIYETREHSALGKSPMQAWTDAAYHPRMVDERALDVLLMPIAGKEGMRTVTKFGVRIDGNHYVIQEALPGDRLQIRIDPVDVGRAHAFDADTGRYVGQAICSALAGISSATLLAAKRERQAEIIAASTADARRYAKELTKGRPLIERAIEVARRDMPNVVPLPRPATSHTTPAIDAAVEASRPKTPVPAPMKTRTAEIYEAMREAAQRQADADAAVFPPAPRTEQIRPIRLQETRQQRFRKWIDLKARLTAGEEVSQQEAYWVGSYEQGSEWKAMNALWKDGAEF